MPNKINQEFLNAIAKAGTVTGSYYSTSLDVTKADETVNSLMSSLSGGITMTKT